MSSIQDPVVRVENLRVEIDGGVAIVNDVSFEIAAGELLGVVGQSGSGKTTVGMALLGYARDGARVTEGRVEIAGVELGSLDGVGVREMRGSLVSYVPQDPRASLNPTVRIGDQIAEVMEFGTRRRPKSERIAAVRRALAETGLPMDDQFLARFPHQLSGGQLQRVGIAMALVTEPPVVVLDEPTTGLDVKTQRRVLRLVRRLCKEHGIAALYVTHDLAAVAELADRVLVLHDGEVVEQGELKTVFEAPVAEYTKRLLAASPDVAARRPHPVPAQDFGTTRGVLRVRNVSGGFRRNTVLRDISFDVLPGECVALVGESGSGKSTLSRILIGLHREYRGEISWCDEPLASKASRRSRAQRRELQYIFQSPFTALNPRKTVRGSIEFAYDLTVGGNAKARKRAVDEVLSKVQLPASLAEEMPHTLSGGERQRVAIARALVTEPRLLICDEVTSALDVLVQASLINLLDELRKSEGLSMVFVTHDLALVRSFADRVIVLNGGTIVEEGPTEAVLGAPQHPYTVSLMENTLSISGALAAR
ncbi:ABC transporter ATP-binding protein [Leifsonia kafniensis]|uniref:ABC transporter ATP-binding protein n=1 Tax=Leifsonia kafniensis TaxID=475957 RepID=A0ABP7KQ34_9MICO